MSENIVRIEQIGACIDRTLRQISEGVALARANGTNLNAELPEEVKFSMLVVVEWQALDIANSESGTTRETQGGNSTETTNAGDSQTSTDAAETISKQANFHNETQDETMQTSET